MKYSIFDACFSEKKQVNRGLSASYLSWELSKRNIREYGIADSDVVLVSCQSTDAANALRVLKGRYPDKIIISGGAGSTSPYSLGLHSAVVCVGDGQAFLDVLFSDGLDAAQKLPNAWINGESRRVSIDYGFPWDMPPIQAEDGAYRLWAGRGCKHKCKFCQTGWAYRYLENPNPQSIILQAKILRSSGKKIAYLSNDLAQHSFYRHLPATEHGSYSLAFLKKNGLPPARQVRIGVEGVSERLRKFVSKPISNEDLVGSAAWLCKNKKSVRWFMIAGLPTETSNDWDELKEQVQRWKAITPKGVLALSFTAFCPDPAAPLSTYPLVDDYYDAFLDFKSWFFDGAGWSNRVKIMGPQRPDNRMKKAILSMGLPEKKLREGGHTSPNSRLLYPYAKKVKR